MTLLFAAQPTERSPWHFVSGSVVITALYAVSMTAVRWFLI